MYQVFVVVRVINISWLLTRLIHENENLACASGKTELEVRELGISFLNGSDFATAEETDLLLKRRNTWQRS